MHSLLYSLLDTSFKIFVLFKWNEPNCRLDYLKDENPLSGNRDRFHVPPKQSEISFEKDEKGGKKNDKKQSGDRWPSIQECVASIAVSFEVAHFLREFSVVFCSGEWAGLGNVA